jgi:hypothetical protein
MIENQSIFNCIKTIAQIALYSNISMCMGHGTTGIFPPLSLSLTHTHTHTFGVIPRKVGWKPTYSPQLSSKTVFEDSTNKLYTSGPHNITYNA